MQNAGAYVVYTKCDLCIKLFFFNLQSSFFVLLQVCCISLSCKCLHNMCILRFAPAGAHTCNSDFKIKKKITYFLIVALYKDQSQTASLIT